MNCLLKHSHSFVIGSIIRKLIENIYEYPHLLTTEDFQLLLNLDKAVGDRGLCHNECLGCLEFTRMAKMFFNFREGVSRANKENEVIVTELCDIFSIAKGEDPIVLALELIVSSDYVKSKITEKLIPPYVTYLNAINSEVSRLAMDHFSHEQAKCFDRILTCERFEQEQVIAYKSVRVSTDKELFYVDQNVISKYGIDKSFSRQIESFKTKLDCHFIYSPYVIEDGVKMSRVRLAEYFDSIEKLTGNIMLVPSEGSVNFVKENINTTLERVLLWREATRAAEDLKVQKMHFNYWGYPHFSKKSRASVEANKNIREFLQSLHPHLNDSNCGVEFNDDESERALCQRLSAATIGKSFTLKALVDGSIKHESDAECMMCIVDLCDFLDLINYQTESLSELRKIRSSLQDTEHLKHAWKADYFVTDDNRLRMRGDFIYSALGLNTKFISTKELKNRIAKEFKK